MKHTTLHSPDAMFREANALDLAGFSRAAEMLRQGAELLENVQAEIFRLDQFLDDGWGGEPCQKTIKQTVQAELTDLRNMLPEKDDKPMVFKPGELRYCTSCGRTDALKVEIHDGCYTVCCGHCVNKHRGGYASTPERAIELWNNGVDWTQQ